MIESNSMNLNDNEKENLLNSYEQLRLGWLSGDMSSVQGLALFLRSGMKVWILSILKNGRNSEDISDASQEMLPPESSSESKGVMLPSGVYAETIHVFSQMALNKLKELYLW